MEDAYEIGLIPLYKIATVKSRLVIIDRMTKN